MFEKGAKLSFVGNYTTYLKRPCYTTLFMDKSGFVDHDYKRVVLVNLRTIILKQEL